MESANYAETFLPPTLWPLLLSFLSVFPLKHHSGRPKPSCKRCQILTPSGTALFAKLFSFFNLILVHNFCLGFCLLRFSPAMESVTPSTPVKMGTLPSSPPREVWGTALSWCWTSNRMNTYLSGEKRVRKASSEFKGETQPPGMLIRWGSVWIPADETSFEAGIKVQIHSQDEPSFIDQLGFGVAPGFQTFVSCQEQRVWNILKTLSKLIFLKNKAPKRWEYG